MDQQTGLYLVRQEFSDRRIDAGKELDKELERFSAFPFKGKSIAVAAGSRGITGIDTLTRQVIDFIRAKGGDPFIYPSMGSHGGATAEGQLWILSSLGITEQTMNCRILASMEVEEVPGGSLEIPVYMDRNAWNADGVILINRIKPHTDFHDRYESGLAKMAAIGSGKKVQAALIHGMGMMGLKETMPRIASQIFDSGKVIGGIAIVEDAYDQTMLVRALHAGEIMNDEPALLVIARENLPSLPAKEMDILIVDRLGKDISGIGMDPNIMGRMMIRGEKEKSDVRINRIMVDDLTEASHGNALGIGLADVITRKLFDRIDFLAMYENILTSTHYERARVPIIAQHAADAFRYARRGCYGLITGKERIVRIRDTMHLDTVFVSESILEEIRGSVEVLSGPVNQFRENGELTGWDL